MTEVRPRPALLPVDEVTQAVLGREVDQWWHGLNLAERLGVLRDVGLANERRTG